MKRGLIPRHQEIGAGDFYLTLGTRCGMLMERSSIMTKREQDSADLEPGSLGGSREKVMKPA